MFNISIFYWLIHSLYLICCNITNWHLLMWILTSSSCGCFVQPSVDDFCYENNNTTTSSSNKQGRHQQQHHHCCHHHHQQQQWQHNWTKPKSRDQEILVGGAIQLDKTVKLHTNMLDGSEFPSFLPLLIHAPKVSEKMEEPMQTSRKPRGTKPHENFRFVVRPELK